MKKMLLKIGSMFTSIVLLIGILSTNVACVGPYYQSKLPDEIHQN